MKGLNVLAAFLGGAAVGAAIGILFAPEKGEDTRQKIAEILRKKGIRLNRNEMENLVDEIAAEIKGEANQKIKPHFKTKPLSLQSTSVLRKFCNIFYNSRSIWNYKRNIPSWK